MSTAQLHRIAENLVNGNLTAAKRAAKRASWFRIYDFLFVHLGWSQERAELATRYLKQPSNETFQQYADAR